MKRKFIVVAVIGTLLLGGVTLLYATTGETREAASTLEDARDEALRIGLPTSMDDVLLGSVEEARNAAPLILEASALLDSDPPGAAERLMQASRRPACEFAWPEAHAQRFWKSLRLEDCVALLLSNATESFAMNDPGEGRRALRAAHGLIRLVATYPTVDALLHSRRAERTFYEGLGALMVENPQESVLFPTVQAESIASSSTKTLLNSFRDFVAIGNEAGRTQSAGALQAFTTVFDKSAFPLDPWGPDAVEATHLKAATSLMHALDDANDWIGAMATLQEFSERWSSDPRQSAYTLRAYAPTLIEVGELVAENEAARRILFIAATAFRYRIANRQFPLEIPVQGTTSLDPFINEPFPYEKTGLGFGFHSIGADGLDNGGSIEQGLTFGTDVSFYYKGEPVGG